MRMLWLCPSLILALFAVTTDGPAPPAPANRPADIATFSIVAFDPETGDVGVAVQSKFFGVGAVVPWARADVGAVATQAFANANYGPVGLAALDGGARAIDVVAALIREDDGRDRRQVGVVDARGGAAAYTGARCHDWAGHRVGKGYCCQGNILAGKAVVDRMAETYETSTGTLAERLVKALAAGQAAGGDKRGRQSAALLVARRGGGYAAGNDRYIDLHVEDHKRPIDELSRLLKLWRRSMPPSPVPSLRKGLTREARVPGAGMARTARGAWRLTQPGVGIQYLGTRFVSPAGAPVQEAQATRATVLSWHPGHRDVRSTALTKQAGGHWAVADQGDEGNK